MIYSIFIQLFYGAANLAANLAAMLALCELGTQHQMFLNCIILYFMLVFNFIMFFFREE